MYGIFTYIWLIYMVNVGKYTSPMDPMGSAETEDGFHRFWYSVLCLGFYSLLQSCDVQTLLLLSMYHLLLAGCRVAWRMLVVVHGNKGGCLQDDSRSSV